MGGGRINRRADGPDVRTHDGRSCVASGLGGRLHDPHGLCALGAQTPTPRSFDREPSHVDRVCPERADAVAFGEEPRLTAEVG